MNVWLWTCAVLAMDVCVTDRRVCVAVCVYLWRCVASWVCVWLWRQRGHCVTVVLPGSLNDVDMVLSPELISSVRIDAPDDIPLFADDFCQPFLLVLRSLISFRLVVTERKDCY